MTGRLPAGSLPSVRFIPKEAIIQAHPQNANERLIARIRKAPATGEDKRVLDYIRKQLAPDALAKREERGDAEVAHLHWVAKSRLKPYEKEASAA